MANLAEWRHSAPSNGFSYTSNPCPLTSPWPLATGLSKGTIRSTQLTSTKRPRLLLAFMTLVTITNYKSTGYFLQNPLQFLTNSHVIYEQVHKCSNIMVKVSVYCLLSTVLIFGAYYLLANFYGIYSVKWSWLLSFSCTHTFLFFSFKLKGGWHPSWMAP